MTATTGRPERTIHFEVDAEVVETDRRELTPVEIMELAGIDPANHYLSEIHGHKQVSLKDTPTVPVKIHENSKFVSASTGPTPVS